MILNWSIYDESEYTEGTSFKISIHNPTKKTIKYIWFSIKGLNPVGDPIVDSKKGTSIITVRAVGPVEPDNDADCVFDYVWFTDLVETAKITKVKVQYMDGTLKIIENPNEITIDKSTRELLNED